MNKLAELAIRKPLLIVVIFLVLVFFGIFSYNKLNYNLMPKMEFPVVSIITTYRGASAKEIENNITKNIEDGISSMEGIKRITSTSREGVSLTVINFNDDVDVNLAQTEVQRKINQVMPALPKGVDAPIINKFSTDDLPVLQMSVRANEDGKDLFDLLDQQIKPELSNIKGVGQVNLIGANERQIHVDVDQNKLDYYGISIAEISNTLINSSLSVPAGKIETLQSEYNIEFDSKFTGARQLQNLIIRQTPDGGKIYLRDVASVSDSQTDPTTINHINGIPSIGLQVQKQNDANAVEVSRLVKEKLKKLEADHQNIDLHFDIAVDQSTYTLDSANAVMKDLLLAILIVSVVMLFFLHSLRNAAFVLVALPASILPTFIGMYLFDMSLNLMTLMALSLVVGILVDDSIVILENIMRHLEMGKNRKRATVDGRYEIGFTAIAITSVDLVVFLPMSMVSGIIGNIIREFSLTVVFSTALSLFVAFTLTPLMTSIWGKISDLKKKGAWGKMNRWFENQITKGKDQYTYVLKWALTHKKWVFIGTFILFFGSFCLPIFGFIGSSFIGEADQGQVVINLELDPNASLYETNRISQKVEQVILKDPRVVNVFSNIGVSQNAIVGTSNTSNLAEINVKLIPKEDRKETDIQIGKDLKEKLNHIPGVKITVSPVSFLGGADQDPIQIVVKGSNREQVREAADKVMEEVKSTAGILYPAFSTKSPKPEVQIELDRNKMGTFGINSLTVGAALGDAFRGNDQAKYRYNGNEYDILVKGNSRDRTKVSDIKKLVFTNNQGQRFTLDQFANVKETMGEAILERNDRLPSITVHAQVGGRSIGTVGSEVENKINRLKMPDGVSWNFTGEMEYQQDAFSSLLAALLVGVVLVYLIMTALYENAVYPVVVMMAMPLAVIGAFLALALTMNDLTVFSIIGMIMLIGLVTKNGILLVDFINQRKAEGEDLIPAIIDAGRERFRPILMTTIAMIAGMLPIALAKGSGAEVKNGMAWVLIGGLTSSLIMTLVVVPCVYYVVDKVQDIFRKERWQKKVRLYQRRQLELAADIR